MQRLLGRLAAILASTLVLAAPALAAETRPLTVAPDPVFRALEDEVARAQTLGVSGLDKPYWVAAYAQDLDRYEVAASFGALLVRDGNRHATIDTQVRVGDMSLDNTNYADDFWGSYRRSYGVPIDPDYDALRHSLWLAFDEAYKKAAENIAKKRAYLQANEAKDRPADFSPAPVAAVVLPRATLELDRERWTRLVKKASASFRDHPSVQTCRVGLQATVSHQYFVSSEGGRHLFPDPYLSLTIRATTQAPDGMELSASWERWGRSEKDLPSDAEVLAAAKAVAARLEELAKAPAPQEDYAGPVLFTGRAAALFYLSALADPLSRPRDDLGNSRGGRLIDRLGKHVTAKAISVRDDPTQTTWKGQPLLGHFPVDDDSVVPRPITLVESGVLKTYYMSRVPTRRLTESNGHSRNGQGAAGNLFVETSKPQPVAALTRRLLELAREEDYDYGVVVEDFETGNGLRSGRASEVSLPSPSIAWKVFADGRREPLRGYTFKSASFRILKDIEGLGDDPTLANVEIRNQRTSSVAPSTLVRLLELQKPNADFEKPPYSVRP